MPTVEDLNFQVQKLALQKGDFLILKFNEAPPTHYRTHIATHTLREALATHGHGESDIHLIVLGPEEDLSAISPRELEMAREAVS